MVANVNPVLMFQTTGLITLKNLLDFENVKQYIITVRASDKGTPSLDTTGNDATVTINVIDVNEKPVFDPKEYSSVIPELTTGSSEVVTVTATDPDNGDAGMIVYSIISGDDNGDFSVDEVSYFPDTNWNRNILLDNFRAFNVKMYN